MNECGHIPEWAGERVRRTNARGRHSYCADFKAWIVEQARRPGMSTAGLAMRNQVNANQLRRWVMLRNRSAQATPAPSLLPVQIAVGPPQQGRRTAEPVEIEVAGVVVRVRAGVEPAALRTVLDVLRGSAA